MFFLGSPVCFLFLQVTDDDTPGAEDNKRQESWEGPQILTNDDLLFSYWKIYVGLSVKEIICLVLTVYDFCNIEVYTHSLSLSLYLSLSLSLSLSHTHTHTHTYERNIFIKKHVRT